MSIRVMCPNCGHVLNAPDAGAGKRGKCSKCAAAVQIPAAPVGPLAPPAPARVVKAAPFEPPSAATFDVEIEEDSELNPACNADVYDVEVEEESPLPRPSVAPSPPPRPVDPNPWATFGPPPDSAAAKLKSLTVEVNDLEPDEIRTPLHPGWRAVADGLSALKRSTQIGFVVALLAAVVVGLASSGTSAEQVGWAVFVALLGMTGLFALLATIFLVLGLIKCLKMPEPEDGGSGRQLVLYVLIATGASLICGVAGLAVPFLLGAFMRAIGNTLPSPPTTQAANRFMIATGLAVVVSLLAPIVNVAVTAATVANGSADMAVIMVILVTGVTLVINMLALLMYLVALSTAEAAIQSLIRVRGLGQPPKQQPHRTSRPRRDDEDDRNPFV